MGTSADMNIDSNDKKKKRGSIFFGISNERVLQNKKLKSKIQYPEKIFSESYNEQSFKQWIKRKEEESERSSYEKKNKSKREEMKKRTEENMFVFTYEKKSFFV